jgi:hypothetical protein
MKRTVFPLLCALFLCFSVSRAAEPNRFDGTWDTVLSCSNTDGALGYSFKFPSIVKDSTLHGEKGTKGQPGWLQIQGKIQPDGNAKLYTNGLVGASEVAVGHRPPGTEYGYHVDAKFTDQEGSGKRVEGRPCEVTFSKTK